MKVDIFVQVTAGRNYNGNLSALFMKWNGEPFLRILIKRLQKVTLAKSLYLLFPDNDANRGAVEWAQKEGYECVVGSSTSPISRLCQALEKTSGEHFVRIPAEYLLLNAELTDLLIHHHLLMDSEYTTSSKLFPVGFIPPDIFSKSALVRLDGLLQCDLEKKLSVALLFQKYLHHFKSSELQAPDFLRRPDLKYALESEFEAEELIFFPTTNLSHSIEEPRKIVHWAEQYAKTLQKKALANTFSFQKLTLSLTNECNLFCRMCSAIKSKQKHRISEKTVRQIVQFAVKEKFEVLELTGGEPLLLRYLPGILSETDFGKTRIHLTTNGLLLDEEKINLLNHKNITVQISIDGFEDTHDHIRGVKGAFKKTTDNIKKMVEKNMSVALHTVIQKSNIHQIFELFIYFQNEKIFFHSLALIERMKDVHSEDLDIDKRVVLKEQFDKIIEFQKKQGNAIEALRYEKLKELYTKRSEQQDFFMVPGKGCEIPYKSVIVNPDGNVIPCWHYQWNFPEKGFNVNNTPIEEIVNNPLYKRKIYEAHSGKCHGCNTLCYGWEEKNSKTIFCES